MPLLFLNAASLMPTKKGIPALCLISGPTYLKSSTTLVVTAIPPNKDNGFAIHRLVRKMLLLVASCYLGSSTMIRFRV